MNVTEKIIDMCNRFENKIVHIHPEHSLIEDLGMDFLDIVELLMEIEEEFKIEITDDVAEKFVTVGQIINYVGREI